MRIIASLLTPPNSFPAIVPISDPLPSREGRGKHLLLPRATMGSQIGEGYFLLHVLPQPWTTVRGQMWKRDTSASWHFLILAKHLQSWQTLDTSSYNILFHFTQGYHSCFGAGPSSQLRFEQVMQQHSNCYLHRILCVGTWGFVLFFRAN